MGRTGSWIYLSFGEEKTGKKQSGPTQHAWGRSIVVNLHIKGVGAKPQHTKENKGRGQCGDETRGRGEHDIEKCRRPLVRV